MLLGTSYLPVTYLIVKYQRYVKFAIVGGVGSIINWSILYALTEYAGLWYILSSIIGLLIVGTINYFANHYWTFKNEKGQNSNLFFGWMKYQVSNGLCSLIYLGVLALLTEKFGVWYMFSAMLAVLVSSTAMFFTVRKMVWGKK